MLEILVIVIGAVVAAFAFLYQRGWERRERRLAKYETVMDALPGLMAGSFEASKVNRMIGPTASPLVVGATVCDQPPQCAPIVGQPRE